MFFCIFLALNDTNHIDRFAMNNFDWTSFTLRAPVKSSPESIYNAWTTKAGIEQWFLSKATFTDLQGNELAGDKNVQEGDSYAWNWYLYDVTEKGTITAANGKDFLQFTFAGNCLVEIKLSEKSGYTIIELTQKNIPVDDESKRNIRLGCHTGWSFYLMNIKSVCEGGVDLRNKDASLGIMLNN